MHSLSRRLVLVPALIAAALALAMPTAAPAAARITGGSKTDEATYQARLRPLVALVRLDKGTEFDGQFCAGTLIDELHVLTAGHCIVDDGNVRTRIAPGAFGVLAGSRVLAEGPLDRTKLVPVASIFVNPFFNIRTMRWDAAVLRLSRPITDVPTMPRLTTEESVALGIGASPVTATVAGWGDTDPATDDCCFPTELVSVDVPVRDDATCTANLANAPGVSFSTEFQFCAGRLRTSSLFGADTCQGDSGGPLLVDVAGTPRLAGVTSFGVGCGQRYLGVYARTTALAAWLDSIPGIPVGDTRDPAHGPGDLAAPIATGSPVDFDHVRIQVTAPTSGATPTGYTVWAREGAPASAQDIYLGQQPTNDFVVYAPPTNTTTPYRILVRATAGFGEGPTVMVRTRPVVDSVHPTRPLHLKFTRAGAFITASWGRSVDRQSGLDGYFVQRKVAGRWRAPVFVAVPHLRIRVGRTHGALRVLAEDRAGNDSAWTAAVSY